jgi:hypothetical protein
MAVDGAPAVAYRARLGSCALTAGVTSVAASTRRSPSRRELRRPRGAPAPAGRLGPEDGPGRVAHGRIVRSSVGRWVRRTASSFWLPTAARALRPSRGSGCSHRRVLPRHLLPTEGNVFVPLRPDRPDNDAQAPNYRRPRRSRGLRLRDRVIAYNEAAPQHGSLGDADPAVASTPASMIARSPRFIAESRDTVAPTTGPINARESRRPPPEFEAHRRGEDGMRTRLLIGLLAVVGLVVGMPSSAGAIT